MGMTRKTKLTHAVLSLCIRNCTSTRTSANADAQGARAALAANSFHSRQPSVARAVVRAAFENASFEGSSGSGGRNSNAETLSAAAVTGIVVGSVLGGVILVVILGVLIRWLSHRSRTSSGSTDTKKPATNPETKAAGAATVGLCGAWRWCCGEHRRAQAAAKAQRARPVFGTDRQDPDDISDTSFVLPELGGPNPHNKFDGMEWVDIRGMDDEALVEISSDLRKYSTSRGHY